MSETCEWYIYPNGVGTKPEKCGEKAVTVLLRGPVCAEHHEEEMMKGRLFRLSIIVHNATL